MFQEILPCELCLQVKAHVEVSVAEEIIAHRDKDTNEIVVDDIAFSKELDDRINYALNNFLNDYCKQVYDNVISYEEFIHDAPIEFEDVCTYALNQRLTLMTYDEILEGDSKYYKSTQDEFKRQKENQGSGVPLLYQTETCMTIE